MKIATLCFPIKNSTIFLANKKLSFGAGLLNGYGGKANEGENIDAAACREFEEEADIEVSLEHMIKVAVIDFFKGATHLFECHVYFADAWEGELKETEEMGMPEEFPLSDVPFERMWKGDRIWLPLLCEGKKIRAKVIYSEGMEDVETFEWERLEEI